VTALGWALSLGLVALTLAWLDLEKIVDPLRNADPLWVGLALAISVPMLGLLAWRWSFTARRMGVGLSLREAWREYYVSTLINQVLPGGVGGDVLRVARQRGDPLRSMGPVARSVVVERAMGQLVLWLVLLATAAWWGLGDLVFAVMATLGVVTVGGLVFVWLGRHPRVMPTSFGRVLTTIFAELRAAVIDAGALGVQLSTSVASLLGLVAMFYCCAAAVGSVMTPMHALLIVPWVLASTVLPLTVGGWGVRELSAMVLFPLASIPAAEGAASSILFGVVSLVASLPGLVPLVLRRRSDRS